MPCIPMEFFTAILWAILIIPDYTVDKTFYLDRNGVSIYIANKINER